MTSAYGYDPRKFKWISFVKSIFDECGLSFIWEDQIPLNRQLLKSLILQKLNDQFIQQWFSQMNNSSRGIFYSSFKTEFQLENYLVRLNSLDRLHMAKFRCSNLKIPIETGRWTGVPRNERTCNLCNNGIGDEFHYLFLCQKQEIKFLREKYIPSYFTINPREYKLTNLLLYCNTELYKNICNFIRIMSKYL